MPRHRGSGDVVLLAPRARAGAGCDIADWRLALVLTSPCLAHHGVAPHYDASKPVTLEGVVAKFDFINPHSFVYIDVVDAAGNTQTWSCEMASRSVLSRNGLTAERFQVGAKITIHGDAARHKATGCQVRTAQFADGTVLRDTKLYAPTYAAGGPPRIADFASYQSRTARAKSSFSRARRRISVAVLDSDRPRRRY